MAVYSALRAKSLWPIRSLSQQNVFHVFATKQEFNLKDKSRQIDSLEFANSVYDVLILDDHIDLRQLLEMQSKLRKKDNDSIICAIVRGGTVVFQSINLDSF